MGSSYLLLKTNPFEYLEEVTRPNGLSSDERTNLGSVPVKGSTTSWIVRKQTRLRTIDSVIFEQGVGYLRALHQGTLIIVADEERETRR
jgi:hypothetical protein